MADKLRCCDINVRDIGVIKTFLDVMWPIDNENACKVVKDLIELSALWRGLAIYATDAGDITLYIITSTVNDSQLAAIAYDWKAVGIDWTRWYEVKEAFPEGTVPGNVLCVTW